MTKFFWEQQMLKIFIGYDQREAVAWHTMAHSIMEKSSIPISFVPVNQVNQRKIFTRPIDSKQSNEFSISRFLVPHLSDYSGYSVFFDCDMLVRVDIAEILNVINEQPGKAVYCVQHSYEPKDDIKYLNTVQYKYPRKNWSSVVLWNCGHHANKKVDLNFVNNATPMELHRFSWLKDDEIGALDVRWNWLVGEYAEPPNDVKNIHWTVGGPYFNEYKDVDFSDEWRDAVKKINYCEQREL